ncbi:hypothetical protein B0H14DRAFT_2344776, partial [Mycena olivaceomarginata]
DEATSSVDVETDAKLQRTIRTEFTACILLCIAHRLNTIGTLAMHKINTCRVLLTWNPPAYYDHIVVMDQGEVAEFDSVLSLCDKEDSIF